MIPKQFGNIEERGAEQSGRASIQYPSPYFDLSQTYFPNSIKELFRYCVYFYNTNCIVPAIVNKLAEYPVTDLVFAADADKQELQEKWKALFDDHLNMHRLMHEIGLDMGVYGNCFLGIYLPFKRFLICPNCGSHNQFSSCEDLKVKTSKLELWGTCPKCGGHVHFKMKDRYLKTVRGINIIRYDPMSIDIVADPVSGNKYYIWDPPQVYKDNIKEGKDMDAFEKAPKVILEAIAEEKVIKMRSNLFYHMKRPSLSGQSSSWGYPLVMHALKSLYYLQTLKRAQEAIAVQHIIPLWILFPQTANGSSMPAAAMIGLSKWKSKVESELAMWKKDPNYIPIINEPVGMVQLGGEGRALLLGPEIQQEVQQIIASMSVPQEFVFGGMTWTGSSITLRMLENCFTGTRDGMQRFLKFCIGVFSKYLNYQPIDIYMSELKMADDIQRQQIAMNLEAAGKISATRLLAEFGYDFNEENKLKKEEASEKAKDFIRESILQAKAQGEGQMKAFDYQIKQQLKQMEAEGAMQVAQAKSQAIAQQKMMEMGILPPPQQDPNQQGGDQQQQQSQDPNQQQQQDQGQGQGQQVDPETGLPIDPQSGLPYDEQSGMLIDTAAGCGINPQTGEMVDLQSGQPVSQEEYQARLQQSQQQMPPEQMPEDQLPPEEQMAEEQMLPPEEQMLPPEEQMLPPEEQMLPPEEMIEEQLPPEAMGQPVEQPLPENIMQQPPVDEQIDPMTGLPIDPESGLPFDAESGMLIDVYAGCGIYPTENVIIDLQTGQPVPPEEYAARQQSSLVPPEEQPIDMGMDPALMQQPMYPEEAPKMGSLKRRFKKASLEDEDFTSSRRQEQEARAHQAVSSGTMPASVKSLATSMARQLSSMQDLAMQRNILFQLQKEMPTLHQLVRQRMGELTRIQPAIKSPASMDEQKYVPGIAQSTGMAQRRNAF